MLTLVEFLEEIERNHQAVTVPADELEHLVHRFGDRVRQIGFGTMPRMALSTFR